MAQRNVTRGASSVARGTRTVKPAPYQNATLPAAKRVKDLLSRMTLEEKAAQMMCVWREKADKLVDAQGNFDLAKAQAAFGHGHGIGQVGRPSDAGKGQDARGTAELANAIQKFFIENSRLGIPVIFHEECLHGHAAIASTSFSQPIGLGATFDPDLVERLFTMTALEARVRGAHQALTPVVDVAREPRWGRVEETYGEDPYLVSRMAIARFPGRRQLSRQNTCDGHPETLRRARPTGVGNQLRSGQHFRAGASRNVPVHFQGSHPEGRRHQRHGFV